MMEERFAGDSMLEPADESTETEGPAEADAEAQLAEPAGDVVQAELARLRQEAGQMRELYVRELANFDNYRKRKEKEIAEFRRQANAELIRELLPVIDNLERALAASTGDAAGLRAGVELTHRQFMDVLARLGVDEVDPLGQTFDPTLHEAVSRLRTDRDEPNTVVQVLLKGYRLGDRLLRAALVVVAVPMAAGAPDDPAPEVDE